MSNIDDLLETRATFTDKVLDFCDENDLDLLEGLTEYINIKGIEIEDVSSLITNEFKAMLRKEAVNLNMFRTTNVKVQFDD